MKSDNEHETPEKEAKLQEALELVLNEIGMSKSNDCIDLRAGYQILGRVVLITYCPCDSCAERNRQFHIFRGSRALFDPCPFCGVRAPGSSSAADLGVRSRQESSTKSEEANALLAMKVSKTVQ